ncbi:MAG: hypothetical protein BGN95_03070 [Sphingomonas sp. 66-10]|uniref:DUF1761 family protein n=1 Tax=Sphingomonas sp. 66-10 TaxID=1895848 RepID=UPI0009274869|nr:DUF1761 family protein [Sphingomonas sp. 66-10]OJU15099.1 MAG: hypothetical protein BGN95_03070 [Sphingomonas sp. 66-10]
MTRIVFATVLGVIAASLADWLFMGIIFHSRYHAHPEVWRDGGNEHRKIILAQACSLVTVLGFIMLSHCASPFNVTTSLTVAGLIWLIGPLPLLLGNHLFIKLDPTVTASHAAGWLVKLMLIGAIVAAIL